MFPSASPLPGRRTSIMALALILSLAAAAWPASLEKALVLSGMSVEITNRIYARCR